ncbi:MAG: hypothetical protein ACK50F_06655 [Betaproteobacteria bacterium]
MEERSEQAIPSRTQEDGGTTRAELQKPVQQPTYADLVAYVETRRDLRVGEQQALNRMSALRQFLELQGLSSSSPVGQELGAGFDDALSDFVQAKTEQGRRPRSIANACSALRVWQKSWREWVASRDEPKFEGLADAIKYYAQKFEAATGKQFKPGQIARLAGLGQGYISALLTQNVKTFKANKLENLAKVEELLGAPPTSLTRFVALERERLADRFASKRRTTRFGRQVSDLLNDRYRLKELPPHLLQEVREFIRFKTLVRPPRNMLRNEMWRTKPVGECVATERVVSIVSIDGKTFSAAASRFLDMVEQFFGIMVLKGHDPAKFSLAWMCDRDLIDVVIQFGKDRVGAVTTTTVDLVENVRSLLFTKGWLYQQPQFALKLYTPSAMSEEAWKAWCTETRMYFRGVLADLEKDNLIKKGRDTEEPISDILQRDHPITALLELVEEMERYLKKYESQPLTMTGMGKAVLQRDILIFKILTVQPHRARMMKIMKWTKENTGNLYKRANGVWAIRFAPEDFKNEKGAARDRAYDVELPKALGPEIENYLTNVRPKFDRTGDYVFFTQKKRGHVKEGRETQGGKWINVMVRYRSRGFLKGCIGFGPHAIRHIVATDYIKNNPESFMVAAHILHDKLETVIENYAHLKAADGHKVFQQYLDKVTLEWRKA